MKQTVLHTVALSGLLLAGCTVGPDYQAPPPVAPSAVEAGAFRRADTVTHEAAEPAADWWTQFNDPLLDQLQAEAAAGNPEIEAAQARLAQARSLLRLRRSEQMPQGGAGAAYARQRPSLKGLGTTLPGITPQDIDLFDLAYDASWEIDLFGGRRRAVESAVREMEAAEAARLGVRAAIAAECARAYTALRSAQRQLALTRESIRLQGDIAGLVETRVRLGVAASIEQARIATLLDSTRAEEPALQAAIILQRDRLALLTGAPPGALDARLTDVAAIPRVPETVALGDPARLLQRRPDVRVAERRLAAATARIGVATAELYPTIRISGVVGLQANSLGGLDNNALTYGVGPSLRWAFPDFGRVRSRIEATTGQRDEAVALYHAAVLNALHDVEGALVRFDQWRREVALRRTAEGAAAQASELARARYRSGAGSLMEALDAERDRVAAAQALANAEAGWTQSTIALHQSLGAVGDGR